MTTWLGVHRLANVAAAQAHHDLGADTSHWRIDVAAAIARDDVLLFWRDLPRLFGAYINEPGDRPGIIVNAQLSFAARRHTAGHELGHHRFGHSSRVDGDLTMDEDAEAGDGPVVVGAQSTHRSWPEVEKVAESFASWFLMPRQSVLAGLRLLGIDRPRDEVDVYLLSVMLGVPYRSLVRHLLNIRLASNTQTRAWAAIAPSRVKTRLDRHVLAPASRRGAVWAVTPGWDGQTIPIHDGDRLVLPPAHQVESALPPWLDLVPPRPPATSSGLVLECSPARPSTDATLELLAPGGAPWQLQARYEPEPSGVDVHWQVDEGL